MTQLILSSRKTLILSMWRIECWTWITRVSWWTMHKPTRLCFGRYMVKVIKVCQWWVMSALVFFRSVAKFGQSCAKVHQCIFAILAQHIYTKTIRTQKQWIKLKLNVMSFVHGGCYLKATTKEGILTLSKWLGFWHFCCRQWGGHMIIVSASPLYIFKCMP